MFSSSDRPTTVLSIKRIKQTASRTDHKVDFKVLTMPYKALNGLGPRYLAEHLLPPSSARITHSSQAGRRRGLMTREVWKERTRNRDFSAVAPSLCNNLPVEIRLAPSLGVFRSKLKAWLFEQASCCILNFICYHLAFIAVSYTHLTLPTKA